MAAVLAGAAVGVTASLVALGASAATPTQNCHASHLQVRLLFIQGAAGSRFADFSLQNTGPTACRLHGYPKVTLLGSHGQSLHVHTQNETGFPVHTVTLAPGKRAYWTLQYHPFTSNTCPDRAHSLLFTPPGDHQQDRVPFSSGAICRDHAFVRAVRAMR